jgi:hypothetical protein
MNEVIHNSLEEAREACREYYKATTELQKKFGVWEECDDSNAMNLIYAKYRNPLTGKIENYEWY